MGYMSRFSRRPSLSVPDKKVVASTRNKTIVVAAFFVIAVFSVISSCHPADKESFTIGLVNPNPGTWSIVEGFIAGMGERGYVEGKNVTYIRISEKENLVANIRTLAGNNPDLIFTVTTPATEQAKAATVQNQVPVVFILHDPVSAGIVDSLPHPGGNLTGIQLRGSTPKALEWLLTATPAAKNIYVPVSKDTPAAEQSIDDLRTAASKLEVNLKVDVVDNAEQLKSALENMPTETDAIFLVHSILITTNTRSIVEQAIHRKIPVGGALGKAEDGIMVTYATDHFNTGRQASRLADRILHGAQPADLPVEVADFYLGVNIETADVAGIRIPEDMLQQADFVIRPEE